VAVSDYPRDVKRTQWLMVGLSLCAALVGCDGGQPANSAPVEVAPPPHVPPLSADPANRAPPLPAAPPPDERFEALAGEVNQLADALLGVAMNGADPRLPGLEGTELTGEEQPAVLGDAPRVLCSQLGVAAVAPGQVALHARCWVFPDGRVVWSDLEVRPGGRARPTQGLAEACPPLEEGLRRLVQLVRNAGQVPLLAEEHLLTFPDDLRRDLLSGDRGLPKDVQALLAADTFQARVVDVDVLVYGQGTYGLLRATLRVRDGRLAPRPPRFGILSY
jgi:hypothetical protein